MIKIDDFLCRCGREHDCHISDALISIVQLIDRLKPLTVTSGYRCPEHNADVGGVPDSLHIKGLAADLVPADGDLEGLADLLEKAEPARAGILIYQQSGFVHFDLRGTHYRGYME